MIQHSPKSIFKEYKEHRETKTNPKRLRNPQPRFTEHTNAGNVSFHLRKDPTMDYGLRLGSFSSLPFLFCFSYYWKTQRISTIKRASLRSGAHESTFEVSVVPKKKNTTKKKRCNKSCHSTWLDQFKNIINICIFVTHTNVGWRKHQSAPPVHRFSPPTLLPQFEKLVDFRRQ